MAMESPALADALVAWASGHLSTVDHSYRITALEARSAALCALVKAISYASDDISCHETNTATCLVLLTSEVCLGYRTGWYNHLVGAKNIIMSARAPTGRGKQVLHGPEAFKKSPEGQWVLRNFAYHDILGSVTLGTNPLISGSYLEGITDVVDTYLGVASQILIFISDISCLDLTPTTAHDHHIRRHAYTDQDIISSQKSFSVIEHKLQYWRCQADTTPALAAVAYAYRSAALIYLYRWMRSRLRDYHAFDHSSSTLQDEMICTLHAKIRTEVSSTLGHISNVPVNGIPESALLFPLFLAGGEATDSSHIEMVRGRLRLILEKRHFQNVLRALEVLEEVWDRRQSSPDQEQNSDVDWKDILSRQGGGLLLT